MKSHRCFNLDDEAKVKKLYAEKLSRMEKGKAKVGDETSEGANQQQLKEYLLAYCCAKRVCYLVQVYTTEQVIK